MIVSVHSYKGGTGKTLLSANLATLFAAGGKKTCLLDTDFHAPSLHALFQTEQPKYWLNDYMNGTCKIDKVLLNPVSEHFDKGKLFVGLANPSTEAIREMVHKDRKWERKALLRLFSLRTYLFNKSSFDYLIIDTSPGFQCSAINAVVVSDIALVVTTLDKSDVEGTQIMLSGLYETFEKKTAVIVNKVPSGMFQSENINMLQSGFGALKLIFNGAIACSCDIPRSEKPCFIACEKQDYSFSRTLEKIASEIAAHQSNFLATTIHP